MNRFVVTAALAVLAAACQTQPSGPAAAVGQDIAASRPDRPRGTYVVVEPDLEGPRFGPGPQHRILFLNRQGGTYTEGSDNSSINSSIIPFGSADISAWSWGDPKWSQLVSCVRDMYGRFDIEVTEFDPGELPHIEAVVGGTPGQVGMPDGVGGVAPVSGDCSVVERAVVYAFAGVYNGDVQSICETVAQESAHAFGLDHEYLCEDPMTYLFGCGAKTFQDVDAPCGEGGPRTCMCGGSTQNSVQILLDILGPASPDPTNPTVTIASPSDGELVPAEITIVVNASDNNMSRVQLLVDGRSMGNDTSAPYSFTTPSLVAGLHTIEAVAVDGAGNVGSHTITVESIDPLCTGGCGDGFHCEAGLCVPDGAEPGEIGTPCFTDSDCISGFCGGSGDSRMCTESCVDSSSCPEAFECRVSGGQAYCWPGADAYGTDEPYITGTCATTGGRSGGAWTALTILAALLLVPRRRRAS